MSRPDWRMPCLWRDLLVALAVLLAPALLALCALSDVRQLFKPDQCVRVLLNDLFGDGVVGLQFQPSLSLLDASHQTFRATSAFFLQAFAQSCAVVGFVPDSFSWLYRTRAWHHRCMPHAV